MLFAFASPLAYAKRQTKENKSLGVEPLQEPLAPKDENFQQMKAPISFSREFQRIKESLSGLKGSLRYKFINATPENIKAGLRSWPVGVHFSMHGFHLKLKNGKIKSTVKTFEKYQGFDKNHGDFLLFERTDATAMFF